jgi:hypothetical protein
MIGKAQKRKEGEGVGQYDKQGKRRIEKDEVSTNTLFQCKFSYVKKRQRLHGVLLCESENLKLIHSS